MDICTQEIPRLQEVAQATLWRVICTRNGAMPAGGTPMSDYFLEIKNLTKYFPLNNDVLSRLTGKTYRRRLMTSVSSSSQEKRWA